VHGAPAIRSWLLYVDARALNLKVTRLVDGGDRVLRGAQDQDDGVTDHADVLQVWRGPAGVVGGALVFVVPRWWSGCRGGVHSAVTSVTAARALDSSTMALLVARRDEGERRSSWVNRDKIPVECGHLTRHQPPRIQVS